MMDLAASPRRTWWLRGEGFGTDAEGLVGCAREGLELTRKDLAGFAHDGFSGFAAKDLGLRVMDLVGLRP